jgi:hypothetical protein
MTKEEALGKLCAPNFPSFLWEEEGILRLEQLEKDGFTIVPTNESYVDYLARVRRKLDIQKN